MNAPGLARTFPATLAALLIAAIAALGLAAPAAAADYTPQQRKEYFDSGKYSQDLSYVASRAKRWIVKRTQPTLATVRACRRAGYRIGKKDPGPNRKADYRVPVTVPKSQEPRSSIVEAPDPGLEGKGSKRAKVRFPKTKRRKHVTKRKCAHTRRLAIALDMDETATSSFRYGSPQANYDTFSMYRNEVLGSQTALNPMRGVYRLARKRGAVAFVITARYDPLTSDPLVGTILGGADLCDPGFSWTGACGLDIDSFNFRKVTRGNLVDEGYTGMRGLYMRPPDSGGIKDAVKNSQRAEIVRRRGYKLIAMFGDQNSDLRTGFYERGFKFQSSVTPDQD